MNSEEAGYQTGLFFFVLFSVTVFARDTDYNLISSPGFIGIPS